MPDGFCVPVHKDLSEILLYEQREYSLLQGGNSANGVGGYARKASCDMKREKGGR